MDDAKRAAEVLYRYLKEKARYKKMAFLPTDLIGLEKDIRDGLTGFYFLNSAISIDPKKPCVIVTDEEPRFFEAVINGCDDAIDMDADLLNQVREYVLNGGASPRLRWTPKTRQLVKVEPCP